MVIMQMCPPLMSIQMKAILSTYFGQTLKVSILDGPGKGSCPTHAIEKPHFQSYFCIVSDHGPERQNPLRIKVNRTFSTDIHAATIFPKICVNPR